MSGIALQQSLENKKNTLAWLIWGLAAAYFFFDYMARVSTGVMGRDLQIALGVSASGLGLLSSFFYYPYIAMQIPVGILVDKYSIRRLLAVMSLMTALGCVIFGMATNLWVAAIGRALIGFSAAFAFVSALRLATMWFPVDRLGLLAGLTQAVGMWGAAFGEAPVSLVMNYLDWRQTMVLMALFFGLLAVLISCYVQDKPNTRRLNIRKSVPNSEKSLSIGAGLKKVLSNKQTWYAALYAGFLFAPSAVIAEFWGPSYLRYGRGMSGHAAAFANGLIFIGWGLGGPIAGWVSDKLGRRKPVMWFSALAGLGILSIIFYAPHLSTMQLYILFTLYGVTNIGVVIAYAVATEINPTLIGASIAIANMGSIFIGAILQPIFGTVLEMNLGHKVVDIAQLTNEHFAVPLSLLPLCSLIAFLLVFLIKETYCRPVNEV